jgi:hypothetical protein
MNASRLTPATLIAAVLAAVVLVQAPAAQAAPEPQVVRLPTVHVVAHRSQLQATKVVQLPRVEVVVKRSAPMPTMLAQKAARADAL